jgi:hypothetical protein
MSRWHKFDHPDLPELAFRPRCGKFGGMTLEGGGGGTPPPDPRLVDAQIRNLGIQDDAIQRVLANAERMQPLQEEAMRFGLDSSRTAYDQSQQDREWVVGRRGLLSRQQDRLVSEADSFNTEDRRNQLAGEAIGDVNQAFSAAQGAQSRGLTRMGVNPNDGRYASMGNQMAMGQALAQSNAANKVRQAARMEGMAMTDRATNALAGYPAMGMQMSGMGAGFGASGLGLMNQGLAGMNSGFTQAGGMAGQAGQGAGNMWGSQASAYNAGQAQDGERNGAILGTVGTIAAAFI